MRKTVLAVAVWLACSSLAWGQAASNAEAARVQPEGWARVEALRVGTSLHVTAAKSSVGCKFQSATEESLLCVGGGGKQVFARAEIKSVKVPHRGRSTLVGLAIGAGAGAAIGAPLGQSGSFVGHGAAALIIGVPGAVIGAIVGVCTDFTHSTVYKVK